MALNGKINATAFTDQSAIQSNNTNLKVKTIHIEELRNAVAKLNTYLSKVDNCGFTNCCQSCQNTCNQCTDRCQTCQNTCNQCTDSCQSCQNTCSCQSQCTSDCYVSDCYTYYSYSCGGDDTSSGCGGF